MFSALLDSKNERRECMTHRCERQKPQSRTNMEPEAESLLETIILAADLLTEFSEKLSEESYLASSLDRSAVEHQVFIIGEALSRLSHIDSKAVPAISNARKIISVRDALAQGHGQIDDVKVWDILQNDLPDAIADVRALRKRP